MRSAAAGIAQWYDIVAVEPCAVEVLLSDKQAGVDAVDVAGHDERLVVDEPRAAADATTPEAAAPQRFGRLLERLSRASTQVLGGSIGDQGVGIGSRRVTAVEHQLVIAGVPQPAGPTDRLIDRLPRSSSFPRCRPLRHGATMC